MNQGRWLLGVACLLVGCGNVVSTTQLNAPPRPMSTRTPESVEVYSSTPPTRPHVDVALLQVEDLSGAGTQTPKLVAMLVQQAAERGCDALFISGMSERSPNRHALFDSGSQSVYGTCIAYTTPSAPNAPPPSNAVVFVPEKKPEPPPRATLRFRTGVARR